jgi:hypothetical protein
MPNLDMWDRPCSPSEASLDIVADAADATDVSEGEASWRVPDTLALAEEMDLEPEEAASEAVTEAPDVTEEIDCAAEEAAFEAVSDAAETAEVIEETEEDLAMIGSSDIACKRSEGLFGR